VSTLLAGIVFLNVGLLEGGADIARMNDRATVLKRQNAGLREDVARLGSSERIQTVAAERGFVHPRPGDVGYLTVDPRRDASRAAQLIQPPAHAGAAEDAGPAAAGIEASAPAAAPVGAGTAPAAPNGAGTAPAPLRPSAGTGAPVPPSAGSVGPGTPGASAPVGATTTGGAAPYDPGPPPAE
jgi:hypothetical protein